MELCQNVDNAVVLARRDEIRSPENCLLCVFGQANPAPTADNWIGRFSFDTLPFLVSDSLCLEHSYRACIVSTSFAVCH
mgnify:FL=1